MVSWRADPAAKVLADRHYNRQNTDAVQFVPPGRCLVLRAANALWVTSWPQYAQHAWRGAWINTTFRNEGTTLSSDLIRSAVAATRWTWPEVPDLGMVTFVDPTKIRRKRDPGRCYRRAGFVPVGHTKGGLLALQLAVGDMPDAAAPGGAQLSLSLDVTPRAPFSATTLRGISRILTERPDLRPSVPLAAVLDDATRWSA